MNIETLIGSVISYLQNHAVLAIGIVAVLGVLVYLKPKEMFKLTLAVMALGAIVYLGMFLVDLTSTGMDVTSKFLGSPNVK
jgi:hypothetical protein